MRALLAVALIAAPGASQVPGLVGSKDASDLARSNRAEAESAGYFMAGDLGRDPSTRERAAMMLPIRKAAAWGRCVVAAAPDLSRAYVDTKSADPALRPVFNACLRRTGDFAMSNWGDVRRAALSDALAQPR